MTRASLVRTLPPRSHRQTDQWQFDFVSIGGITGTVHQPGLFGTTIVTPDLGPVIAVGASLGCAGAEPQSGASMPLIAYTRAVSPRLAECELTHLERDPLDVAAAEAEHAQYEAVLASLGAVVRRLASTPHLPDGVFVEDAAVVLDDVALITRPGAISRRPETESVAAALGAHRPLLQITSPGTLDGGDVLVCGRTLYIGLSTRTSRDAIAQAATLLEPFGCTVVAVEFGGCLHLKSAVTRIADDLLLLNPQWVRADAFAGLRSLAVDPSEPHAANALALGGGIVHPLQHARTRTRIEAAGFAVRTVPQVELAKAEAGVTCCSLLVAEDPG